MLPASNRGLGMNQGFPDVCNTPTPAGPVPIPYPNIAMNAQATPFSPGVKICMMNALNMGSKIPMTSGDEAGTASPIKGPSAYTMGSPNVSIDGMPAITLTCPTTGNNMNNPLGAVLVPSQMSVNFSYLPPIGGAPGGALEGGRADVYARALSAEELAAMHDALVGGGPAAIGALLPRGVGYLRVTLFTPDLPAQAYHAVQQLKEGGIGALVIDLRGNPGGEVGSFLALAEEFLDEGAILARAIDADGDEIVHRAAGGGAHDLPAVVLVDRSTASAAELFAGCLQAHGRAVVVGETTYGKGAAQQVMPAASGAGVVYATALRYQLPGGGEVEGTGIHPDVAASTPGCPRAESPDLEGDTALRAAWEVACTRSTGTR